MTVPGFVPADTSWRTTVAGFTRPERAVVASPFRVELDGIILDSRPTDRVDYREVLGVDGWWGGVERRVQSLEKPISDGSHEGVVLLGNRPITVTGLIGTPSRGALLGAMDLFGGVLSGDARYGTLVVREQDRAIARQARVTLVQPTDVVPLSDKHATFSWFLRAADPIRYDAALQSLTLTNKGANQAIQNTGNTPVGLTVTLRGPLVTPSLWLDGTEWRLNQTLAAGEVATAYWQEREVFKGSASLRFFQAGPWTRAKPGMTPVGFSAVSGTGTCTVAWRSGWL